MVFHTKIIDLVIGLDIVKDIFPLGQTAYLR